MSSFGRDVVGIVIALFGVAIVAIVLSQKANTTNVLSAGFTGLTNLLTTVLSPITGGSGIG